MAYCPAPEPPEVEAARRAFGSDFEQALGVMWSAVTLCARRRARLPMTRTPMGVESYIAPDGTDVEIRERFEPDCQSD